MYLKPKNLNWIARTHAEEEGKNQFHKVVCWPPYIYHAADNPDTCAHTEIQVKKVLSGIVRFSSLSQSIVAEASVIHKQ